MTRFLLVCAGGAIGNEAVAKAAGLDQGDLHVFRFDPVQAVSMQFMGGVVQFRRQLDASSARADNRGQPSALCRPHHTVKLLAKTDSI